MTDDGPNVPPLSPARELVSDGDTQAAREAHWREVAGRWEALYREAVGIPATEHQARRLEEMAQRVEVADAELARLRARVAELEAERDASVNAHARAIVQLSEWMERAEGAEADLVNAWLAVEEVADEVDRVGSLADYIRSLAAAGPAVSDGEGATSEADDWCVVHDSQWPRAEKRCADGDPWDDGKECRAGYRPASPVVAPSATDEEGA